MDGAEVDVANGAPIIRGVDVSGSAVEGAPADLAVWVFDDPTDVLTFTWSYVAAVLIGERVDGGLEIVVRRIREGTIEEAEGLEAGLHLIHVERRYRAPERDAERSVASSSLR